MYGRNSGADCGTFAMRPPLLLEPTIWPEFYSGKRNIGSGPITRLPDHPINRFRHCATRAQSDPSRPSVETHGDPAALEDDRHLPASGQLDHPLELFLVRLDVDVTERNLALCEVLTGRGRVGSGVLSEDLDGRRHAFLPRR